MTVRIPCADQMACVNEVAIHSVIAGPEFVASFQRVFVFGWVSPDIAKDQRGYCCVRIGAMDFGILNLQLGEADARSQPDSWVNGKSQTGIEGVPLAINAVLIQRDCRRLPPLVIPRIPQRNAKPVGSDPGAFETTAETGEPLDELILIISDAEEDAVCASTIVQIGAEVDAEALLRVINEPLRRKIGERNQARLTDLINHDDVLWIGPFSYL